MAALSAVSSDQTVRQLPNEMLKFIVDRAPEVGGVRLGKILSQGRPAIQTPHYIAVTSRGVVPHIAEDLLQRHTAISGVYMGLEDFVEKSTTKAPVFKTPVSRDESALRRYTALPASCLLIMGPRRVPGLTPPSQNTNSGISISTSVGFRTLEASDYDSACLALKPDVVTGLADLVSADKISKKRSEKSADRTHAWLRDTVSRREEQDDESWPLLFAPILPLEPEQQQLYFQDLTEEYEANVSGLIAYEPDSVALLPDSLSHLPRVCLSDPHTPQDLLRAISLGVDLITVPWVTSTSEHGLALTFSFPAPATATATATDPTGHLGATSRKKLTLDMWNDNHATSCKALVEGCQCYTCTSHHRAYVYHLLQAKEMLAWTLLQIHNFHVLDRFFERVRESVATGSFESDVQGFTQYYEDTIVAGDGKERGPRIRGYHMRSRGGDPKMNQKKWGRFENGSVPGMQQASVTVSGQSSTVEAEEGGGETLENIDNVHM